MSSVKWQPFCAGRDELKMSRLSLPFNAGVNPLTPGNAWVRSQHSGY